MQGLSIKKALKAFHIDSQGRRRFAPQALEMARLPTED